MKETFLINIDHLADDKVIEVDEQLSPTFLDLHDEEIEFPNPIEIEGKAYLASDHLVVQLKVKTTMKLPCSQCNDNVSQTILIDPFYISESTQELGHHMFDLLPQLREAILLEVPQFSKCSDQDCPNRGMLKTFIQKEEMKVASSNEANFPFAEIDKEIFKEELNDNTGVNHGSTS